MSDAVTLLETWEDAQALPPTARLAWLAGEAASLPLGASVAALLARHRAWFGPVLRGVAECPACGARLDVACEVDALLHAPVPEGAVHALRWRGESVRFRLPTLADLAALPAAEDEVAAAEALLDRCLIDAAADPALRAQIPERMAALDPLADAELALDCAACGAHSTQALDVGAFLWREIEAGALRLLGQVDALARAYGWREAEILALSPARRQAYLDLIGA